MSIQTTANLTPVSEIPIFKYGLPTRSLKSLKTDCDAFILSQQANSQQIEKFTADKATLNNTISKIIDRITDKKFVGKTLQTSRSKLDGVKLQKNNLDVTDGAKSLLKYDTELANLQEFAEKLDKLKKSGYKLGELEEEFMKSLNMAQINQKAATSSLEVCKKTPLPNVAAEPLKPAKPSKLKQLIPFSKKNYVKKLKEYFADKTLYKQGMETYKANYNTYLATNEQFVDAIQNYAKNVSISRNIKNAISGDIGKLLHNQNLIEGTNHHIAVLKAQITDLGDVLRNELHKKGFTGTIEEVSKQLTEYFANPKGFLGGLRGAVKRFFTTTCKRPVIFKDAEFIRPLLRKLFRK